MSVKISSSKAKAQCSILPTPSSSRDSVVTDLWLCQVSHCGRKATDRKVVRLGRTLWCWIGIGSMESWFSVHIQIDAEINRPQYVNARVGIYVYISQPCLLGGPRHNDTPVATSTYSVRIGASRYPSSIKGIRAPWRNSTSRTEKV